MFTPFYDVTTHFLNQESRKNYCVQSNERNSHRYADNTISLRQNLLHKFLMVGSKETNQNHPYFYTGTSSQQNAILEADSSISELLNENSNTYLMMLLKVSL